MRGNGFFFMLPFFQMMLKHRTKILIVFGILIGFLSLYFLEIWNIPSSVSNLTADSKVAKDGYTPTNRIKFQEQVLKANQNLIKEYIAPILAEGVNVEVKELPYLSFGATTQIEQDGKKVLFLGKDVHEGYTPIETPLFLNGYFGAFEFDAFLHSLLEKAGYEFKKGSTSDFKLIFTNYLQTNNGFQHQLDGVLKNINNLYKGYLVTGDKNENYFFLIKKTQGEILDKDLDTKLFDNLIQGLISSFYDELIKNLKLKEQDIDNLAEHFGNEYQFLKENKQMIYTMIENIKEETLKKERTVLAFSLSGLDKDTLTIDGILEYMQTPESINHHLFQHLIK